MKNAGSIITILGFIGVIYFGILYMQDTETFSVFGLDVAASTGDYTPIIISAIVMIGGIVMYRSGK